MSDTTSEFVQKLMTLVAKTGTGQVQSDAVSKLVNGFVRSIGVEKEAEKKAKKEAKKNGKKEKSDLDKPDNVYILYCREKRKSITDLPENKGKQPEEITCLLAAEWRKERAQNSLFIKGLQEKADEASLKYKKVKEEARAKEKAKAKEEKAKEEKAKEEKKDEKEPSTPLKKEKAPKVPNAPKKKKVEKDKEENENENEDKAEKAENASKKKTALDFSEQ